MPTPHLKQVQDTEQPKDEVCLFAQTDFRNQQRKFGIKIDDRRRHMYVIGKTGMGKTTMLENMVLHDIYSGHGVGIVDPHGDFAEKIIDYIPAKRINDLVYINPADIDYPIGFNILEVKNEEQKHLVAAGLMAVFKKIWPDVWSARMEYILNNTLLALLDVSGTTLLGINRLLSDKAYRRKIIRQTKDPVIKGFWTNEFANYEDRYAKEAVAPIQNKIGQFLSANIIRNMVAQVKSTIDIRSIMDTNKILVMNLSKGRIGEDNSRLLGGMLVEKIKLAAMERVDMPESERKDFFLYVDEFQNFATPSFANILSEARKYRLSLIMAHQYVAQLDEVVADAVFGNVGSMVSFRVGAADAEALAKEYAPTFTEEDIVNLPKFQVFLKLMIDGVASQPFSAMTLPPIGSRTGSMGKVVRVSRERYAKHKSTIEDKIMRWSGMEPATDDEEGEDVDIDTTKEKKKENRRNKEASGPSKKERKKPQEETEEPQAKKRSDVTVKTEKVVDMDEPISLKDLPLRTEEKDTKKEEREEREERSESDQKVVPSVEGLTEKQGGEIHAEQPKKKKRRRKRKKKKGDAGAAEGKSREEKQNNSPEETRSDAEPVKPQRASADLKPMKQDTPIRFEP